MANDQWTTPFTIQIIEKTWGKYQDGMKGLVIEHLETKSCTYRRALFAVMGDFHDGNWPPSRAEMLKNSEFIGNRMSEYSPRIDPSHRIEEGGEPYVDPEVGLKMVQDIINKITHGKVV